MGRRAELLATRIEEGAAEIGICSGEAETRSLEAFHYRYDNLVVVVRSDHPLAARETLSFADTLDFDHVGSVSVAAVLSKPDEFIGETLADPLEGAAADLFDVLRGEAAEPEHGARPGRDRGEVGPEGVIERVEP
jgi:DNA-binding transcriptional LysR family regulator